MRTPVSTHTTIHKILMNSNNTTNLNLSFHPPNPCLLLLPRSHALSLPPLHMHPSTFSCHIQIHLSSDSTGRPGQTRSFFRCDLNWDSVGTFLRVAGREFQRDCLRQASEYTKHGCFSKALPAHTPGAQPSRGHAKDKIDKLISSELK